MNLVVTSVNLFHILVGTSLGGAILGGNASRKWVARGGGWHLLLFHVRSYSCLINTNDSIRGRMSDVWSTVRSGIVTVKMWVSSVFLIFFMFYVWFHTV